MTIQGRPEGRMGICFKCPVHLDNGPNQITCYLGVWFANPLDNGPPYKVGDTYKIRPGQETEQEPLWNRVGDSFDSLTLSPSINAEGHWHGFITNGEVS